MLHDDVIIRLPRRFFSVIRSGDGTAVIVVFAFCCFAGSRCDLNVLRGACTSVRNSLRSHWKLRDVKDRRQVLYRISSLSTVKHATSKQKQSSGFVGPSRKQSSTSTPSYCPSSLASPIVGNSRLYGGSVVVGSASRDTEQKPGMSSMDCVSAEVVQSLAHTSDTLCAVCSIRNLKKIRHGHGRDAQERRCYRNLCTACGSKTHNADLCHLTTVKEEFISQTYQTQDAGRYGRSGEQVRSSPAAGSTISGSQSFCATCKFTTHCHELFHPQNTFGRSTCPHKNGIRLAVRCLEEHGVRALLLARFPQVKNRSSTTTDFIEWLGEKTGDDCLNYAVLLNWIMNILIKI